MYPLGLAPQICILMAIVLYTINAYCIDFSFLNTLQTLYLSVGIKTNDYVGLVY